MGVSCQSFPHGFFGANASKTRNSLPGPNRYLHSQGEPENVTTSVPNGMPALVSVDHFRLRAVGRTDVGVQRTQNEDAFYVDDALGLYLVFDGMGGHASGQVASDLAVRTVVHALKTQDPPPAPGQEPLIAAMHAANTSVYQRAQMDQKCHGMGTTAVGVRVDNDLLNVCHCGDSRAYLLRNSQFIQSIPNRARL